MGASESTAAGGDLNPVTAFNELGLVPRAATTCGAACGSPAALPGRLLITARMRGRAVGGRRTLHRLTPPLHARHALRAPATRCMCLRATPRPETASWTKPRGLPGELQHARSHARTLVQQTGLGHATKAHTPSSQSPCVRAYDVSCM